MDKKYLLEMLKSEPLKFSLDEIECIMNEELGKPPQDMDTHLIDACAEILEKGYGVSTQNSVKIPTAKKIKFSRIIAACAVVMIVVCVAVPVSAKYIQNDVSEKIVHFYENHFNLNLENGKKNADVYSDKNDGLIDELSKKGVKNVILPSVVLTDDYETEISYLDNDGKYISAEINISNSALNITGYISLSRCIDDTFDSSLYKSEINGEFTMSKQITVNGMDIIVFSDNIDSFISYADSKTKTEYNISLENCNYKSAVNIAESVR